MALKSVLVTNHYASGRGIRDSVETSRRMSPAHVWWPHPASIEKGVE